MQPPTVKEDLVTRPAAESPSEPMKYPIAQRYFNHWRTRNPDEILSYPRLEPLPYLKESKLIQLAQQGDISARNQVWMHYARLVFSVVNRFHVPDRLLADAVQEGSLGIKRAIEKFQIERFHSFSTYAWRWIYQYIQRFLVENLLPVRIPSNLFNDYMHFRRDLRDCREPGEETSLCGKWCESNPSLYHRVILLHAIFQPTPLHHLNATLHPSEFDFVEHVEVDWAGICLDALTVLHERERSIIQKRYGLFGERAMTLEEIGGEFNLTRERIRQIQEKAERRLRRRLKSIRFLVTMDEDNSENVEV